VDDGNVLWNPARTLTVNVPTVVLVARDEEWSRAVPPALLRRAV